MTIADWYGVKVGTFVTHIKTGRHYKVTETYTFEQDHADMAKKKAFNESKGYKNQVVGVMEQWAAKGFMPLHQICQLTPAEPDEQPRSTYHTWIANFNDWELMHPLVQAFICPAEPTQALRDLMNLTVHI